MKICQMILIKIYETYYLSTILSEQKTASMMAFYLLRFWQYYIPKDFIFKNPSINTKSSVNVLNSECLNVSGTGQVQIWTVNTLAVNFHE